MSAPSATLRYGIAGLERLAISGIRGFGALGLKLPKASEGPLLVIGRNGTCKTTLLRCIALAAGSQQDVYSLLDAPIGPMVHLGCGDGRITLMREGDTKDSAARIWFESPDERGMRLSDKKRFMSEPRPFVAGYGASRFFTGPESSSLASYALSDACATLFNRPTPLGDPELTLRRLKDWFIDRPDAFARVWRGIRDVVGLTSEDEIEIARGGGLVARGPTVGGSIDFRALADGYRVTFNWVIDFYAQALRANAIDPKGHVHGVLLIDEIEQHLHPVMQLEILPRLSALFPHVQIIATTHSPQVALSVAPENLVSLKREIGLVRRVPAVDFSRFSVEDVLTDHSLFESPAESPALQKSREEYRLLRRKDAKLRSPQEELELSELARKINPVTDEPLALADPQLAALLRDMGR